MAGADSILRVDGLDSLLPELFMLNTVFKASDTLTYYTFMHFHAYHSAPVALQFRIVSHRDFEVF